MKKGERMEKLVRSLDMYGIISLLVLLTGLIFYVTWSSIHNAWTDIGTYSITVPLVLLGVFGFLLSIYKEK